MDSIKTKLFLLVEKYGNFSAVADEFSYTPSAISHMADSLEEELGIKLFKRTNKGVSLTPYGIRLKDKFHALSKAEEDLMNEVLSITDNNRELLRIGTYSSIALHFLPGILQSFKKLYPYAKTTISVDDDMQDWIEKGIADIILADERMENSEWQPLYEDSYVAVVHEDEFASSETINVKELYSHTFIKPTEANLNNYLDYSLFSDIIEVNSIENNSLIFMVKEKLGITILPSLSLKALPPGVKAVALTPEIKRTIGIVYDKRKLNGICENFVRHIKKEVKNYR